MLNRSRLWFKGLTTVGKTVLLASASVLTVGVVSAAKSPNLTTPVNPDTQITQTTKQDTIETKTETTVEVIPFTTGTIDDNTIANGVSQVRTTGVNGEKTKTWSVTYRNGLETSRKITGESISKQPVNQVIVHGTYVAPAYTSCPNGTYTNTYGNVVCSPFSSPTTPAGATAQCADGTYSYSQSRSGTCSHHGGVSTWL